MNTQNVDTKQAIERQHAASHAYRLARDAYDADPARARARAPAVAALQQAAAHAYADAVGARVAATGI
ncbi:hypothetical protein LGN24_27600 [Burkholderia seminalis]|uniref:hypothetical protein n=1 Tax=Burkholderia seminalis TaxID=488731 RepID=UPI001CF43501|nr:hypothetical protein [Burkholderia seminalis]MCA8305256.1 hypothetical protein [Burkholderia seminalis]